jgi:hypothetical protein
MSDGGNPSVHDAAKKIKKRKDKVKKQLEELEYVPRPADIMGLRVKKG